MKRRKGVTVFAVFTLTFAILAIASYLVILFAFIPQFKGMSGAEPLVNAFDLVARNKDIIAAFSNFENVALTPHFITYGYIGVFLIVTVIWLIVGLRRGRNICIFFVIVFLLALYADLIYNLTVLPITEFVRQYAEDQPLLLVPLIGALVAGLGSLFAVILFIVDMATGRVAKAEEPTFIKEPTEEVEKTVTEEVIDEEEVKKEEAPEAAPAIVEEEVKEEKAPEAQPEEEETPAPAKKPSAPKKVNKEPAKKAPAKKAEEKKPEAKKAAPKKAPAKKAEPKKEDEARKTGTIVLENEEGKSYAKAFHVSRRAELNKWQVKATGSDKALKLFNTQKEAIEYANQLAKNQNVSVRVHSKEGKIRKHQ